MAGRAITIEWQLSGQSMNGLIKLVDSWASWPIEAHRRRGFLLKKKRKKKAQPTSRKRRFNPCEAVGAQLIKLCVSFSRLENCTRGEALYKHASVWARPIFSTRYSLIVFMFNIWKEKINYLEIFTQPPFSAFVLRSLLFLFLFFLASLGFYSPKQNLQLWPLFHNHIFMLYI